MNGFHPSQPQAEQTDSAHPIFPPERNLADNKERYVPMKKALITSAFALGLLAAGTSAQAQLAGGLGGAVGGTIGGAGGTIGGSAGGTVGVDATGTTDRVGRTASAVRDRTARAAERTAERTQDRVEDTAAAARGTVAATRDRLNQPVHAGANADTSAAIGVGGANTAVGASANTGVSAAAHAGHTPD